MSTVLHISLVFCCCCITVAEAIITASDKRVTGRVDKQEFNNISVKKKILQNLPIGLIGFLSFFFVPYVFDILRAGKGCLCFATSLRNGRVTLNYSPAPTVRPWMACLRSCENFITAQTFL